MLAFVHIEKTAGMSVQQILKRSFGTRFCAMDRWRRGDQLFSARDLREVRLFYPRLEAIGGHWIKPYGGLDEVCPDIRYWTILREPLDRCASHFQHQERMGWVSDFESWIADPHYRDFQTRKLVGSDDVDQAIQVLEERFLFVGLHEHFDESMLILRKLVGGERLRIAYTPDNVAPDASTRQRLLTDPETRAQLERANRADLELYEYVKTKLFPRQQAHYGDELAADLCHFRRDNRPPRFDWKRWFADLKRYALFKPALYLSQRLRS